MKVTEKMYSDESMMERDYYGQCLEIYIDGRKVFSLCEGEPEDMTLNRNLDGVYNITSLMRAAYEAGKNGEDFILEREYIED